MAETQAQRLGRIEEKIDKITDSIGTMATEVAVIHTKVEDLEIRREESHARANKFSERLDHMHECMHDVKAKVGISTKIMYGVGGTAVAAIINEVVKVI